MPQKIVIRISMNDDHCRSKAIEIAFCMPGVESAALRGDQRNEVEVVGCGVDSVRLTERLRKKVAAAELVSVSEVKKESEVAPVVGWVGPPYYGFPAYHCYEVREPACTIL